MVFSFTTAEDRDKLIGYGPIWVFNQCCTTTLYEDRPHIFACCHCGSFAHKLCDIPACFKCSSRDHTTDSHPTDLPLCCINCRKEHAANYTNCNRRRCLLGLNPLPEASEAQATPKKPSRNTGRQNTNKPKLITLKEKDTTDHVAVIDGSQLLEAITTD